MRTEKSDIFLGSVWRLFMALIWMVVIGCALLLGYLMTKDVIDYFPTQIEPTETARKASSDDERNYVVNGIHVPTGLVYDQDFELVRATCTACHSAKLVTQNRATREGWQQMIDWMQETQGLWELGSSEPVIIAYLAKHYAPEQMGRRQNLDVEQIEWYILTLQENE